MPNPYSHSLMDPCILPAPSIGVVDPGARRPPPCVLT